MLESASPAPDGSKIEDSGERRSSPSILLVRYQLNKDFSHGFADGRPTSRTRRIGECDRCRSTTPGRRRTTQSARRHRPSVIPCRTIPVRTWPSTSGPIIPLPSRTGCSVCENMETPSQALRIARAGDRLGQVIRYCAGTPTVTSLISWPGSHKHLPPRRPGGPGT